MNRQDDQQLEEGRIPGSQTSFPPVLLPVDEEHFNLLTQESPAEAEMISVRVETGEQQPPNPSLPFRVVKVGATFYVERPDKTLVPWLDEPNYQSLFGGSQCYHGNDKEKCDICFATVRGMRRFVIECQQDITGTSGAGVILYGIEWFRGGPVDLYWLKTHTTGQCPSIYVVETTHCYNNNAKIIYLD